MKHECFMCVKEVETRHINLYTVGSEGTELCDNCALVLTEICRALGRAAYRGKLNERKKQ